MTLVSDSKSRHDERLLSSAGYRAVGVSSPVSVAVVLNTCRQQLMILGKIIDAPYEEFSAGLEEGGIEEKFEKEEIEGHVVLEFTDNKKMASNPNLCKIQHDRALVAEVVRQTAVALETRNDPFPLVQAVNSEQMRVLERSQIVRREQETFQNLTGLQKELEAVRVEANVLSATLDQNIATIKDDLQEWRARCAMETRYTQASTTARNDATTRELEQGHRELEQQLSGARLQLDHERRVHAEINSHLNSTFEGLTEKLDEWMEKFDKETEETERELENLKHTRNVTKIKLEDTKKQYEHYVAVIEEDRRIREQQRLEREEEKRRLHAVLVIQKWWRSVLAKMKAKKKGRKGKKGKKGRGKGSPGRRR